MNPTTVEVFSVNGRDKVGIVQKEGLVWVAYDLSDHEVCSGSYLTCVWTLQGRV